MRWRRAPRPTPSAPSTACPPSRRQVFAEIAALNDVLRDAWRDRASRRGCGSQGSGACERRTLSAGRPRHRAADSVFKPASSCRRAVPWTPRVRAIRSPPVEVEVVGPRLAFTGGYTAGARGRRMARRGHRRPPSACALRCRARHLPPTRIVRSLRSARCRCAVPAGVQLPASVHRAARQSRSVRPSISGCQTTTPESNTLCVAGNPGARAGRRDAYVRRCFDRRPAGVSIRSAAAWSSSSGWAGTTTSAIRR